MLPDRDTAKTSTISSVRIRGLIAGYKEQKDRTGNYKVVVQDLDLDIYPGEIVGILGPNASGKSTLLRAIVDDRFRLGGSIAVNGSELLPGQVAWVPQAPSETLSPWLQVRDEISLPLRIRGAGDETISEGVQVLLKEQKLHVPLDRKVHELSGGQRVKVAVLRALAVPNHKMLVMDEPFEGLDYRARRTLIEKIRKIAESGTPILITSHRSEDLEDLGARKLRLQGEPVSSLIPVSHQQTSTNRSVEADNVSANSATDENGDILTKTGVARSYSRRNLKSVVIRGILGTALGFALWALAAIMIGNAGLLPGPVSVLHEVVTLITTSANIPNVLATIGRASIWWIVANVMAIPLGIMLGYSHNVYRMVAPWLSLGRCLPVFALTGVATGLFTGITELQIGFLIWLTIFLISLHTLSVSAAMAPRRRIEIASIMGASHWFRVSRIMPFECLGGIFTALEVTLPLAIIVTLVVGQFIFPEYGLALDLYNNMDKPDLSKLFACIIVPGVFAAVGLNVVRRISTRYRYET